MALLSGYWGRFHNVLPAAATFSKDPRAFAVKDDEEMPPIGLLQSGVGAHVIDQQFRRYIDWVSGLGATVFGNRHPAWEAKFQSILKHLSGGYTFSLPHQLELEAGEMLAELCSPFFSNPQVRFVTTGSDALDLAVRLCRAATGRNLVVYNGYHGWHDWYVAGQPPARGVPSCLGDLVKHWANWQGEEVACFVTEHPPGQIEVFMPPADKGLWVLDEIVTGFRYGIPGIISRIEGERYPDLVCFGKALGNSLPIAAVVGDRTIMSQLAVQDPVFVSSTLFGNVLSLAAAKATMEIISGWVMQRIRSTGKRLIRLETELAAEFPFYSIMGDPERSVSYAGKFNGALVRKLLESGVIKNRPNFPTVQHTDHEINKTIEMIRRALVWIDHHQDEAAQIEAFQLFRNR